MSEPSRASTDVQDGCLSSRTTLCPVTALTVVGKFVIAAQGATLFAFKAETSELRQSRDLIEPQSINALVSLSAPFLLESQRILLLAAGSCLTSVLVTSNDNFCDHIAFDACPGLRADLSHRILHISCNVFKSSNNAIAISLLTSQNVLWYFEVVSDDIQVPRLLVVVKERVFSTSRLLFAGKTAWLCQAHILVVAGSAFGTLLIWSFDCNLKTYKQICNIEAHEGAIFGVDVLCKPPDSPSETCFVLTCSDDRRIKLWDLSPIFRLSESHGPACDISSFPASVHDCNGYPTSDLLVAQTWAHLSRIWHVQFLDMPFSHHRDLTGRVILSIGEDTSSELWQIEINESATSRRGSRYQLRRIAANANHAGKNIWSFTVDTNERNCSILTGGADSAIILQKHEFSTDDNLSEHENIIADSSSGHHVALLFAPMKTSYISGATADHGVEFLQSSFIRNTVDCDVIKSFCFTGPEALTVVTRKGVVLQGHISDTVTSRGRVEWRMQGQFAQLEAFSVSAAIPRLGVSFHAGSYGDIYCATIAPFHMRHLTNIGSKVMAVLAQDLGVLDVNEKSLALLVVSYIVSGGYGISAFMIAFDNSISSIICHYHLAAENGSAITSIVSLTNANENWLALGCRNGSVVIYTLPEPDGADYNSAFLTPIQAAKTHDDAITSMLWHPTSKAETGQRSGYLYSTSRDGKFAIHELDLADTKISILARHKSTPPLGPDIEGLMLHPVTGNLIFYGFVGKYFVVYNETDHVETMRLDCGGAHRLWAFQPNLDSPDCLPGSFAWIQASALMLKIGQTLSTTSIKSGGHGRELKACAVRPIVDDCGNHLIATGAEDTDIRIFQYSNIHRQTSMRCISIIRKHNTGIQCLKWSPDGSYLFSSAGCEEFFVWRISRVPVIGTGVLCESALPPMNDLSDLRIMAFDGAFNQDKALPDEDHVTIAMALSDSSIRLYKYDLKQKFWSLCFVTSNSTCCLSTLHLLDLATVPAKLETANGQPWRRIAVTSGSDGTISFCACDTSSCDSDKSFDITSSSFRVHQSMVKTVSITRLRYREQDMQRFLLVSGGDDNSLGITLISLERATSDSIEASKCMINGFILKHSTVLIPRAHAAAISGVLLLEDSSNDFDTDSPGVERFKLISVGNDQRIKTWSVSVDGKNEQAESISVTKGINWHTPVADVSCLERLDVRGRTSAIIVCGVGIDVVPLQL